MGQPPPTKRKRTLALGRADTAFYRSIRSVLHHFGDVEYRSEKGFRPASTIAAYVERYGFTHVLMPNPYGNLQRLACFRELRGAGIAVVASDRGALPNSWFFDHGFNHDSPSYQRQAWDKPLTPTEAQSVHSYLQDLRSSTQTLEAQGPRKADLRRELRLSEGPLLFVPLQRPHDTAVRYFAGVAGSMAGFVRFVERTLSELERRGATDWQVLVKKHPLEDERLPIQHHRIRYVPDATHVHDLIEVADAVMVLNSGVGLLSLCFGKPTLNVGDAFYSHRDLSYQVDDARQAADQLANLKAPDSEAVHRLVHHLRERVYSFAEMTTETKETRSGGNLRVTRRLDFESLRILGEECTLGHGDRVLVVSPVIPSSVYRGSELRIAEMIRALLNAGRQVSLVVLNTSIRDASSREITADIRAELPALQTVEVMSHPKFDRSPAGLLRHAKAWTTNELLAGRHRIANRETCPPAFRQLVAELCQDLQPKFLLVNYAKLAPALPADFPGVSILDTHDYQTALLREDQTKNRKRVLVNPALYRLSEHRALQRFNRIVAINPDEQTTFQRIAPGKQVFFVPAFCRSAYPEPGARELLYDAVFVGSVSTHNVRGLMWFVNEVLPQIRRERPTFSLAIVGKVGNAKSVRTSSIPGATRLGVVPNLAEVYHASRCVIAPILSGAGMKIKVVEALAHSRAVVATRRALDGIRATNDVHLKEANRPEEFAAAVLDICKNDGTRKRLETGACKLHARDHSPASIDETLRTLTS